MTTMQSDMDISATSMVHFIETSTSILHEVPWIELKDFSVSATVELEQSVVVGIKISLRIDLNK